MFVGRKSILDRLDVVSGINDKMVSRKMKRRANGYLRTSCRKGWEIAV